MQEQSVEMEVINKRRGTKAKCRLKSTRNEDKQVPLTSIFMEKYTEVEPLQACRVCLLTDCRLFSMEKLNLEELFKQLTGLQLDNIINLPTLLCAECAIFLCKCERFKEKSRKSQALFNLLAKKSCPVTITQIKQVNREAHNLCSNLSVKCTIVAYCDNGIKEVNVEEITTGLSDNLLKTDLNVNENYENCFAYSHNYSSTRTEFENDDVEKDNDNNSSTETEIKSDDDEVDDYSKTRTEIEIDDKGNDCQDKIKIEFESNSEENYDIKETNIKQPEVDVSNTLKSREVEIKVKKSHCTTKEQKVDGDRRPVKNKPLKNENILHPYKNFGKIVSVASCGNSSDKTNKTSKGISFTSSTADNLARLPSEHHTSKHVCCVCGFSFANDRKLQLHQKRNHLIDNSLVPEDGPCCTKCSLHFLSEEALPTHLNGVSEDLKTAINKYDSVISDELKSEHDDTEKNEDDDHKKEKETKIAVKSVVGRSNKIARKVKKAPATRKGKKKTDTTRRSVIEENELLKRTFEVKKLSLEEQLDALQKRKHTRNYNCAAYKCEICYKATNYKKTLDIHMARHDENFGNRSCDVCHLRFKTYHELYHHKRGHETQYSCLTCPFTSFTFDQAKRHMEFHEGKTFTCELCSETFRKKGSYLSHRRVKHPPSTHVCCLCGFSFLNQQGMRVHHFRKHLLDSTEIPADGPSCDECSLQFLNDEALLTHLRISPKHNTHPKIRNDSVVLNRLSPKVKSTINQLSKETKCDGYDTVCELCGQFVRWFELESHLQEHSGHRYQCTMCDKSFKNKKTWYSHKYARHSGPRTRNCDHCGKQFSSLSNLVRHVRKVHSKTVFDCEICHKPFKDLKQHIEHVHRNKPWPKRSRH